MIVTSNITLCYAGLFSYAYMKLGRYGGGESGPLQTLGVKGQLGSTQSKNRPLVLHF